MSTRPPILDACYLTGPTAVGKTELALALAERIDAEIIAIDSITLYRGMDIGSAKPSSADQQRVPHHLIDVLEPWEANSLDDFVQRARQAHVEIRSRGKRTLMVGGTPLYLKALLRGIFVGPAENPDLRRRLEAEADDCGSAMLHERLSRVDPKAASRIDPADVRRLVRALEVYETTSQPISTLQQQFADPMPNAPVVICLQRPRALLYQRIDQRVLDMLAAGWIEEVDRLFAAPRPPGRHALQAVGYALIRQHRLGQLDRATMIETIQRKTRNFCKHQQTWFRHLPECHQLDMQDLTPSAVIDRTLQLWSV